MTRCASCNHPESRHVYRGQCVEANCRCSTFTPLHEARELAPELPRTPQRIYVDELSRLTNEDVYRINEIFRRKNVNDRTGLDANGDSAQ